MLNEQQRKLIVTNLARTLLEGLPSRLSLTLTAYNEYADAHPAEGLPRIDETTPQERREMTIHALKVALVDLEEGGS